MLSSLTYVHLFTRPTRVTADSATLIDNIFTNNINDFSHSTQGILVKDISDHYPVFHINKSIPSSDIDMYIYKRIYSAGKKEAFLRHLPRVRTEYAKSRISYMGALIWNSILKTGISLDVILPTFKYHLKHSIVQGSLQ